MNLTRRAGVAIGTAAIAAVTVASGIAISNVIPAPTPTATLAAAAPSPIANAPTTSTTGVAAGTVLTKFTGATTVTKCGVTIDHAIIDTGTLGDLLIRASNGNHAGTTAPEATDAAAACVKVTNSEIDQTNPGNGDYAVSTSYTGSKSCSPAPCGPLYIADSTINVGTFKSGTAGSGGYTYGLGETNVSAWRVKITGGPQGLICDGYCDIHHSYSRADHASGGTHMDAVVSNGLYGNPLVVDNDTLACEEDGGVNVTSAAGCSAPIGLFGDNSAITNIVVNGTYFATVSGGHYCSYTGANGVGKKFPTGTNIVWTNNVYDATACKKAGGQLGPVADWAANAGNVWCGNQFSDGTTAGLPANTASCAPAPTTTTAAAPSSSTSTTVAATTTTRAATTTTLPVTTTTLPVTTTTMPSPTTTTVPATTTTTESTFHLGFDCTINTHVCRQSP